MTGRRTTTRASAGYVAGGVALALMFHLWMLLGGHASPAPRPAEPTVVAQHPGAVGGCPGAMSTCHTTAPDDPVVPLAALVLVATLLLGLAPSRHARAQPAAVPRDERGPPRSPGPAAVVLRE